ncbi:site-specific DNA-methyltransferase [Desulfococcaceae bacterium HSG8]|nr:site-specific DNA-methyltransferase [Desulfococcaceae bacterium HSG8]
MLKNIRKYSVVTESDTDNKIIQGDSSYVLPYLRNQYEGKIRCVYIDPPYNNGEKYTHYDDQSSHEDWIKNITLILNKIKPLMTQNGSIWISVDDSEVHYLKVAADKVFGRKNFVTTVVWQQRTTRENRKVFSNNHEYILVYSTDKKLFSKNRNLLPITREILARYKNPDNDHRGLWQSVSANVQAGHAVASQFYEIISPSGKKHSPPNGRCWIYNEKRMLQEIKNNNIWFGKNGDCVPRVKRFLTDAKSGVTPETLWLAEDVGTNEKAKKHILKLFPNKPVFDTPKPERLIKRILDIATDEGDLVLDAFVGSGSTVSVAHKMKRKYIGIDIGSHIIDYAVNRLQLVVKGEGDGISKDVQWEGGGGFKFYKAIKKHKTNHSTAPPVITSGDLNK